MTKLDSIRSRIRSLHLANESTLIAELSEDYGLV